MKRHSFALFLLLSVTAPTAMAQTYGTEQGTVEFTSRVPLHTFTGVSDRLTGEIDFDTKGMDFFVDLNTLETGIGKRDRDMREALETDRFPFAEFTGRLLTPFDLTADGPQAARARGTFTIHGVSRTITVSGTLQRTGGQIRLTAAWEVRLGDHHIEPPRLLLMRLNEVQAVRIDALLSPR